MTPVYRNFLIIELIGVLVASVVFRAIDSRIVAGAIAGSSFVFVGAWIFIAGLRKAAVRRSASFYFGCVHLFVISLPLLITRMLNPSPEFKDIRVLGIPGPVFHNLSTTIYFGMMVATVLDGVVARRGGWRRK